MNLGERLRNRRKRLGLTNGQVALYIGISKAHVSDLENNKSNPSIDLLVRLARYYKTTADYLLGLTDDPKAWGANGDVEAVYNQRDSAEIIASLPDEYRAIVTRLAVALRDLEVAGRERILGQFIYSMLDDIEDVLGKQAVADLRSAIDLLARTGDDSALQEWLRRYLGSNNSLPD